MYISRKSRKLSKNKIFNQTQDFMNINNDKQTQIVSFPVLEYIFGLMLIGSSMYLLYSAGGGINGIKGFNQQIWWQFLVALLPCLFGIGFIFSCQSESLNISRKHNWIITTKTRFFCFSTQQIKKQFSDLVGISVVKYGKQMKNITMANYNIILSFKTCEQLHVLRCVSQGKILDYFHQLRSVFTEEQISQKRVAIQNLL